MSEVKIRLRPDGPLVIEGPFTLADSVGNLFSLKTDKAAIALCRCGQSGNKPFCDGAHKTCGFVSDERAD
jgi:CDGSH-type Zn-finger protein